MHNVVWIVRKFSSTCKQFKIFLVYIKLFSFGSFVFGHGLSFNWPLWQKIYKVKFPHSSNTTLCIQFLTRENNDKNNTLPLEKQIHFTIVKDCAEILPHAVS